MNWQDTFVSVNNRVIRGDPHWSKSKSTIEWPTYLLKLSRLQVEVHIDLVFPFFPTPREVCDTKTNHALYDFSQFLQARAKAADISLFVIARYRHNHVILMEVLDPIALFSAITTVHLEGVPGDVAMMIEGKVNSQQGRSSKGVDLLRKLYNLAQKTDEKIKVAEEAVIDVGKVSLLAQARATVENALVMMGRNSVSDHNNLEETLARVDTLLSMCA